MVQQKSAIKSDDIDCMQKSYHFLRSYFCMFIRSNWVQQQLMQDDRISSTVTILLNNRLQWVLRVHHAFNSSNYEAKRKVSLSRKKDQSETLPHYFVKWRGSVKFLLDSAVRTKGAKVHTLRQVLRSSEPLEWEWKDCRRDSKTQLYCLRYTFLWSFSRPCLSLPIVLFVCCVGYFAM